MSTESTYREYLYDTLPEGAFWRGAAADRFVEALTQAGFPLVEFTCGLAASLSPFEAGLSVLRQWDDYLNALTCVARPTDEAELRADVLAALAAAPPDTPEGLAAVINRYLPLVQVNDLVNTAFVPLPVPSPVDHGWAIIELWYSPVFYPVELLRCVTEVYQPASSVLRIIEPFAEWRISSTSTLAGDQVLEWRRMRSVSNLQVTRLLGAVVQEQEDLDAIDEASVQTAADLFSSLGAGTDITGQTIRAEFSYETPAPVVVLGPIEETVP